MFARSGVMLLFLGLTLAACNESTEPDPNLLDGAGIRFVFPAGADSLTGVRVELWDDAHNGIPAPDCRPVLVSGLLAPVGASVDSCTRMSVGIRNWIGDMTLSIPDTAFHGSLAWGWDQLDDDGNAASPGIYTIESECLDSQGSFTFSGYYYVATDAPSDSCKWILWSANISGPQLHASEFGPFPALGKTETIFEEQLRQVGFVNPFTVRVYANGMEPYEQTINLTEGEYTDVAVTWVPALPVIPRVRGQ
jgi:hypothetical protein